MKEWRMSFGLRRDFWADFLPLSLTPSHLILSLRSFQYHSPSHFPPFIAPEIVYYAPVFQVASSPLHFGHFPCSTARVLPLFTSVPPLISPPSWTPLHYPFPWFLSFPFIGIPNTALSSLPLSSPFLSKCVSVSHCGLRCTYVYLNHKAKLRVSPLCVYHID